jgi:Protein of unknown function (DUF2510)
MSVTPENTPAGWYPDPHGGDGQRYWDGQQWRMEPAAPAFDDRITKTDIKNWAKFGLAGYAAILGVASIPLNIMCGVGFALGLPALAMGFFAYQNPPSPAGKKLALTGMICGGIGSAIGLLGWMAFFALGGL